MAPRQNSHRRFFCAPSRWGGRTLRILGNLVLDPNLDLETLSARLGSVKRKAPKRATGKSQQDSQQWNPYRNDLSCLNSLAREAGMKFESVAHAEKDHRQIYLDERARYDPFFCDVTCLFWLVFGKYAGLMSLESAVDLFRTHWLAGNEANFIDWQQSRLANGDAPRDLLFKLVRAAIKEEFAKRPAAGAPLRNLLREIFGESYLRSKLGSSCEWETCTVEPCSPLDEPVAPQTATQPGKEANPKANKSAVGESLVALFLTCQVLLLVLPSAIGNRLAHIGPVPYVATVTIYSLSLPFSDAVTYSVGRRAGLWFLGLAIFSVWAWEALVGYFAPNPGAVPRLDFRMLFASTLAILCSHFVQITLTCRWRGRFGYRRRVSCHRWSTTLSQLLDTCIFIAVGYMRFGPWQGGNIVSAGGFFSLVLGQSIVKILVTLTLSSVIFWLATWALNDSNHSGPGGITRLKRRTIVSLLRARRHFLELLPEDVPSSAMPVSHDWKALGGPQATLWEFDVRFT